MDQKITNFGLCVIITNPKLSYREIARSCIKCGVTYLQLREKNLSDRELLAAAAEIMEETKGSVTKFVMNDRADLAMLAGADILHLGQGDVTLANARKIVGDQMPIGLSTHSLDQAREAIAQSPAYIGFGPVYPTTTKAIADPTVGTGLLAEVLEFAPVPVIAIGGIFPENVKSVTDAGAKNICLVRHLMECETTDEFENRVQELQNTLQ